MEGYEQTKAQFPSADSYHSMYQYTEQILTLGDQYRPDTFSAFLSPYHRTLDTIPDPCGLVCLNLTRCHIQTLDGLHYFVNLKYLFLDDNVIQQAAEISYLPKVEFVSLSFNPVQSMRDIYSTTLRGLNLNDTSVTDITIQGLPVLKYLSVQNCRITEVYYQQHYNIYFIDLDNTGITNLTLINRAFPNLVHIDVDREVVIDKTQNYFSCLQYVNDEPATSARHDIRQIEYETYAALDTLANYLDSYRDLVSRYLDYKLDDLTRLRYMVYNDMIMLNTAHGQEGAALVYQNYTKITQVLYNIVEFRSELIRYLNFEMFICGLPLFLSRSKPSDVCAVRTDRIGDLHSELLSADAYNEALIFSVRNNEQFMLTKEQLLSEIEIVDHRVEWDPDKFEYYWKDNSSEVCLDLEYLTEEYILRLLTLGGYQQEFGSLLSTKILTQATFQLVCEYFKFYKVDQSYYKLLPLYIVIDAERLKNDRYSGLYATIAEFFKYSLVDQLLEQKYECADPVQFNASVTDGNYRNMGITNDNMSVVMDKTERLDLSFNNYTSLKLGEDLGNLRVVDLSCNFQCRKIEVLSPNIESIDISFTQVDVLEFVQKFAHKQSLRRLTCFGTNYGKLLSIIRNQFKNLEELNGVQIIGKTSYVTDYFIDVSGLDKNKSKYITPVSYNCTDIKYFDLLNHPQLGPTLQIQKCPEIDYLCIYNDVGFYIMAIKPQIRSLNVDNASLSLQSILSTYRSLVELRCDGCLFDVQTDTYTAMRSLRCLSVNRVYLAGENTMYSLLCFILLHAETLEYLSCLRYDSEHVNNLFNIRLLYGLKRANAIKYLNTFSDKINNIAFSQYQLLFYNGVALSDDKKQSVSDALTECISGEYLEYLTAYDGGKTLDCSGTSLQSLNLAAEVHGKLENVERLNASYNRVKLVAIPPLRNLLSLDLYKNCIVDAFPQIKHATLQDLNLSHNPIYIFKKPSSPPELPNLMTLDLSGVKYCKALQNQAFFFLTNLRELKMNSCSFINISNGALLGLQNLQKLEMVNSNLRGLEVIDGLAYYKYLRILDVSYNKITTLSAFMKQVRRFSFTTLNYEGNPFCRSSGAYDEILEDYINTVQVINGKAVPEEDKYRIRQLIQEREEEYQERIGVVAQFKTIPGSALQSRKYW